MKQEKEEKLVNSIKLLKDSRIQRNFSFLTRIEEPTKRFHLFNIKTDHIEALPKEIGEIWGRVNGKDTVDEVVRHILIGKGEGDVKRIKQNYINALKHLLENNSIYIIEKLVFDQNIIPSELEKLLDQVPLPRPTVRWIKETPDISIILETGLRNNDLFFLLDNYYGRIWELLTKNFELRKIFSTMYEEFGQKGNFRQVINFILFLKDEGFIFFQNNFNLKNSHFINEKSPSFESFEDWNRKNRYKIEAFIKKSKVPWFTTWELTYECNFRCNHCYAAKSYEREKLSDIQKEERRQFVLERILDANLMHVTLMGGEPMLIPELPKIIKILRQKNIYTKLVTNGSLLTYNQVQLLEESGLNQIEVSLDGTTVYINDSIRGKGTFEKIISGIQNLKNSSIPKKGICYTVTTTNWYDVGNVPDFVQGLGMNEVFFSKFTPSGRGQLHPDWALSENQRIELKQKVDKMNSDQINVPLEHRINFWTKLNCSAAKTWCVISPFGKIKPCTLHSHIVGDLKKASLQNIWNNSEDLKIMRYPYLYIEMCKKCKEHFACNTCICNAQASVNGETVKNLAISQCIKELKSF